MSQSLREQILEAARAALGSNGTPATGGSFRSRLDQINQTELPCFDLSPGEEKVQDAERGTVERTLAFAVRAIVDAGSAEGGVAVDDSALDPFYVFAVQQLAGGTANLGGLAWEIAEIGNATVFQPGGKDLIGLEMNFAAKFFTKRGDPTQKG